jgi:hypothetical protein
MDLGEMTYSHQRGEPGHCFVAQVYGPDGKSVAEIEPTADPTVATGHARRFAASSDMLAALQQIVASWAHEGLESPSGKAALAAIAKATK